MPVNLSIKNVPDDVVERLRRRAERNHRSLQGELRAMVEEAVRRDRPNNVEAVVEAIKKLNLTPRSEAADIIRADRDSR